MPPQNRRTTSPITDAVYPRSRRPKPSPPKRPSNPRHGSTIASRLDAETLAKLGYQPERKPRRKRGRR